MLPPLPLHHTSPSAHTDPSLLSCTPQPHTHILPPYCTDILAPIFSVCLCAHTHVPAPGTVWFFSPFCFWDPINTVNLQTPIFSPRCANQCGWWDPTPRQGSSNHVCRFQQARGSSLETKPKGKRRKKHPRNHNAPPSMSLPALPLGLVVWMLEGVLPADPEGPLGGVGAGNLVPHVLCTEKIWLQPRPPEKRGWAREAL